MPKALALFCALFPLLAAAAADPTRAVVESGPVRGLDLGGTVSFLGIPYAAPPVGSLRWAPPAPAAKWETPLDAFHYGPVCPQQIPAQGPKGQEDCLNLNVWRPTVAAKPLPVMVWVHGGGNSIGSSSDFVGGAYVYDGAALSKKGVVVVSLNYRLGVLGFLAHPALTHENGGKGSGNYGLLDQLAALRWVRANIAEFGGDPANVTVFGESAGGIDILGLLASPLSRGLFRNAIIESGLLVDASLADNEKAGAELAAKLGCSDLACLRAKPSDDLVRAQSSSDGTLARVSLTVDGNVLPSSVLGGFQAGRIDNGVHVLIGTNADEMTTLLKAVTKVDPAMTSAEYAALVRNTYPAGVADRALELYPAAAYATPVDAFGALVGDILIQCPNRRLDRAMARAGAKLWKYVFSHVSDNPYLAPYRAGHALELGYVFHTLTFASPRELALSDSMQDAWTRFAATGSPDGSSLGAWPRFTADEYLEIDVASEAKNGWRETYCDFWDTVPGGGLSL